MTGKRGVENYLLYDGGCSSCTDTAKLAELLGGGWLEIRSLSDPDMRRLIDGVDPEWPWTPTLLTRRGDEVKLRRGVKMALRVFIGLGPIKAIKLATAAV